VCDFLRERVDTHEKLGLLLLLHSERPAALDLSELERRRQLPPRLLRSTLAELKASGLVEQRGSAYAYAPRAGELDDLVASTAKLLAEQPVEIILALSSNALERVRSRAAVTFAEAFLIGRSKKDR
jgi:DNA-binding IclR family transcriptional regulator